MNIDLDQTAFQLANEIKRVLDFDVKIRISLNSGASYFDYDSDEDAVIVASVSLSEIANNEKQKYSTLAAYELILNSSRKSVRCITAANKIPDPFLYCTYCTLHEIGHHVFHANSSAEEFRHAVEQRNTLLENHKEKLANSIASGRDVRKSQEIFARSYRNMPFEKWADDYAKGMLPEVISVLVEEHDSYETE